MIAEVGLDRCAAPTNARIELANRPGRNARLVESMVTSTRPERDGEAAAKCCTLDTRSHTKCHCNKRGAGAMGCGIRPA